MTLLPTCLLGLLATLPAPDTLEDALALRREGRLEAAISLLEQALPRAAGPERDELAGALGLCLLDAGKRSRADELAAAVGEPPGDSYRLHVFLGRRAWQGEQPGPAGEHLERALALKPDGVEAFVLLIQVQAAENDFQRAAGTAERLEAVEPPLGRELGARMLEAAGDRLMQRAARRPEAMPRALELYQRAREKAPADRAVALKLLTALLNTYRLDEAQAVVDELFPPATQAAAWSYQTGRCMRLAGDLPRAELLQRRALEVEPHHRGASIELARLLLDRSELAEAATLLRTADRRHPDDAEILLLRGLLAEARGSHAQAEQFLRRAVVLDPGSSEAVYQLGLVLNRLGRTEEAQGYLAQIP